MPYEEREKQERKAANEAISGLVINPEDITAGLPDNFNPDEWDF